MKRSIVLVLDGCGAGATADAAEYNDVHNPNTLSGVWQACNGLDCPNLIKLGFFQAAGIQGLAPTAPEAAYGRLLPLSKGKDSVTGHWEMMGIVLDQPFPTFPDGFPIPLIKEFEERIGTQTLANRPASGTKILEELGELHLDTGFPIVYTSADSVFQVACHEDKVPVDTLYEWCQIARDLCCGPNNVQRVIARPFDGTPGAFRRTERRKDFPVIAPHNLVDDIGNVFGIGVIPELFAGRGFIPVRRTQSNPEHAVLLNEALKSDAHFIFANFEDFDMLFGHRNDPAGFGRCLEEFDKILEKLLANLGPEDQLILTADHGNDPCDVSTDHTREYSPYTIFPAERPGPMGDLEGLANIGRQVQNHLRGGTS